MRRVRIERAVRMESRHELIERELAELLLASEVDDAIRRAHASQRSGHDGEAPPVRFAIPRTASRWAGYLRARGKPWLPDETVPDTSTTSRRG